MRAFTPEMFGARGDGTTDDAPAFRALFSQSGELAQRGSGAVQLGPKTYLLATRPPDDRSGANAIVALPVLGGSVRISGVSGMTTVKTTRTGDRFISGEPPAVFGMSLFGQHYGRWEFEGLTVELPRDPALGQARLRPLVAGQCTKWSPRDQHGPGRQASGEGRADHHSRAWTCRPHTSAQLRRQATGALNFGEVYCESVYCLGLYCGIAFTGTAHVVLINPVVQGCTIGYGIQYGGGLNGGNSSN